MINELIIAGVSFFHPHTTLDSLGIETVNGKIFVIHKVDEKETLYAISKRYGATVDAILQSNPSVSTSLEVGQILKVPYTSKVTTSSTSANQVHKVEAKETMFSISKMYGISIDELKQWNNLSDNSLTIGQELIVKKGKSSAATSTTTVNNTNTVSQHTASKVHTVASKETMYSIAKQYGISVQQLKDWNKLEGTELKVGQEVYVALPDSREVAKMPAPVAEIKKEQQAVVSEPIKSTQTPNTTSTTSNTPTTNTTPTSSKTQTIRISEAVKNSDEIMEAGLAELIEGTEGNRKYLALHKTAPKGTILKVRNEMNNREVFVRVLDKLPDNAPNDKVIIKISKSAYDRLGAIDPRFRVEVTYYK